MLFKKNTALMSYLLVFLIVIKYYADLEILPSCTMPKMRKHVYDFELQRGMRESSSNLELIGSKSRASAVSGNKNASLGCPYLVVGSRGFRGARFVQQTGSQINRSHERSRVRKPRPVTVFSATTTVYYYRKVAYSNILTGSEELFISAAYAFVFQTRRLSLATQKQKKKIHNLKLIE